MDWNNDQSRWELSTAALLSLASRALNSVEYDAEVRTSEGLDLVQTRFKIVGTQVFTRIIFDIITKNYIRINGKVLVYLAIFGILQ